MLPNRMKDIKSSGALDGYDIVAQATVSQDEKGQSSRQGAGQGRKRRRYWWRDWRRAGHLRRPAGVLALGAAGAAIGGFAGQDRYVPKEDLEELGDALSPNSSALSILLEDTYTEDAINSMGTTPKL